MSQDFSRISNEGDSHYGFGSTTFKNSKANYTSSANQPPPITASPEAKLKYENRKVETEIEQLHLANQNLCQEKYDFVHKTEDKKNEIQQTADHIDQANKEMVKNWKDLGEAGQRSSKGLPKVNLQKTKKQCVKKQERLEQERNELARICQMLIDELNECDVRIKLAEEVIGDLKSTDLIDMLTRNERTKEAMLQEIEDLQDRSQDLDGIIAKQDREIDKLETFINSPNGLNQQRVTELENELAVDEQTEEHLVQIIEDLKARADQYDGSLINYDRELTKKSDDYNELNVKLVDGEQEVKNLKKQTGIYNLESSLR
ncbi:unnamed protein product [Moneuplotes crassus]|uniref:Uncharacterized protein n=1 Tax=Euplotes crassus TaxID=5936 RepID=A0AAD2CXE7_EUPCR|nr:unnamed protein product [Moneuplotes crassus]